MHTGAQDARHLIIDVERVRRRSRARASTMWFPLLLFGTASLVSAGVVVLYGGDALGPFWTVVGPAGGVITAVHAQRRSRRIGVETHWVPYVAVGVLVLAGTCALGAGGAALGRPMLSAVGPSLVVCAGHLLYARMERSRLLGGLALALAAFAVLLPAAGVAAEPAAATLAAVYGAASLAAGLVLVDRERRR